MPPYPTPILHRMGKKLSTADDDVDDDDGDDDNMNDDIFNTVSHGVQTYEV